MMNKALSEVPSSAVLKHRGVYFPKLPMPPNHGVGGGTLIAAIGDSAYEEARRDRLWNKAGRDQDGSRRA